MKERASSPEPIQLEVLPHSTLYLLHVPLAEQQSYCDGSWKNVDKCVVEYVPGKCIELVANSKIPDMDDVLLRDTLLRQQQDFLEGLPRITVPVVNIFGGMEYQRSVHRRYFWQETGYVPGVLPEENVKETGVKDEGASFRTVLRGVQKILRKVFMDENN